MGFLQIFGAKQTCPDKGLDLPRHDPTVAEWVPPPPIQMPALAQAHALVAQLQAEGETGIKTHIELYSRYPELAWERGFIEVSERALLKALGQICQRVRPYPDKVVSYIIPGPNDRRNRSADKTKVVPFGGRTKPGIRAKVDIPWPEMPARAAV